MSRSFASREDDAYRITSQLTAPRPVASGWRNPSSRSRALWLAVRWSTVRRYISMTSRQFQRRICGILRLVRYKSGLRTMLAIPLLREGIAIGAIEGCAALRSTHLPINKSGSAENLCRPSRDRDRERAACSKRSRSAMLNCGRPWSIRRRPPKCSALSAARPPTCSRSSTPSSRALPGFVGSMI